MSKANVPATSSSAAGGSKRCGFVAVMGAPNAGKSTLVNALVGTKITIVSHKVQTTRVPIRGIVMVGQTQIVLIDTPGIFKPRRRLDRAMVDAAWNGGNDADAALFLFDVQAPIDGDVRVLVERLGTMKGRRVLVLNKIDLVAKERLLEIAQALNEHLTFDATFMISAVRSKGTEALKTYLGAEMPEGPWHYDEDDVTDAPLRRLAAEITREKIYHRLHEELPYKATVETTSWQDQGKKGIRIEQTIFVERESQRSIVLGKNGRAIKQISTESRVELTAIVERPVHLFLFVKVMEGWENDPERYREMGLDFPKG